jgi:hypothetical protein
VDWPERYWPWKMTLLKFLHVAVALSHVPKFDPQKNILFHTPALVVLSPIFISTVGTVQAVVRNWIRRLEVILWVRLVRGCVYPMIWSRAFLGQQ